MSSHGFVLGILFIVVGIPVLSRTIISLVHGPRDSGKDNKRKRHRDSMSRDNKDNVMLEEIYYGLKDLGKRVENLETILDGEDR